MEKASPATEVTRHASTRKTIPALLAVTLMVLIGAVAWLVISMNLPAWREKQFVRL